MFDEGKLCLHDFLSIHKKWKFEPLLFSLLLLALATRDMFLYFLLHVCFLFLVLFLGGRVPPHPPKRKIILPQNLAELGGTPPPLTEKNLLGSI